MPSATSAEPGMDDGFVTGARLGDAFRRAMRRLAATVTIVTTLSADGQPMGMTATAVTSLSAEPCALLVCVNRSASIHPELAPGRRFCINLLAEGHDELSFVFGGKAAPHARFDSGRWAVADLPYLLDAQVNFACTVDGIAGYGSHSIVIGRIDAIRTAGDFAPLVYGDGRFLPTRA